MFLGSVVAIHIAKAAEEAMTSVYEVRAVPGKGLEGDRYFTQAETLSKLEPDREVTFIEIEALEGMRQECGVALAQGDSRRNIVTRGVPLNHLVGREFAVGEVRVRGLRLCEPCSHLARLTQQGVLPGLVHRGGLRAQIMTEGKIHAGDAIHE